jgi:hypothetical protein
MSTLIGDFGERFHAIVMPDDHTPPTAKRLPRERSSQIVQKIRRQQQNAGVGNPPPRRARR